MTARSGRLGHPSRPRGSRRAWVVVGVILLLLVDLVLVALAVGATQPRMNGTAGPIPTFANGAASTPSPTATATDPNPPPPPSSAPIEAPRFLSAVSATVAWRATPGSCTGADAVIEHTADGGATWSAADTSTIGLRTVLYLSGGATSATIVGGIGDSCAPGFLGTFTSGRFWASFPERMSEASYVGPAGHALHYAAAIQPAPCPTPRQITRRAEVTAVACSDSLNERAGAASWRTIAVPGLLAFTSSESGYTAAVSGTEGCSGVAIVAFASPLQSGANPERVGCATAATPVGVTLSRTAASLWLWSDGRTFVSPDSGATW
jgi:hypothetical protein